MSPTVAKVREHAEARREIRREIRDAKDNLAYWTRQQVIRIHQKAKDEAGALAIAWKSTLAAREARLAALDAQRS